MCLVGFGRFLLLGFRFTCIVWVLGFVVGFVLFSYLRWGFGFGA